VTIPQDPDLRPSEAGFVLPLVLIIVAIGAMVVIGLLGYASGLLRVGGEDADALKELYAADAGITHVKRLLEQGSLPNEIPSIEVNDLEVKMAVTPVGTPGAAVPTPWPRPLNPELKEGHLGSHLVTLYSVPEGTKADISWAITRLTPTPTPTPTSIQIVPNPTATPTPTPTPVPTPTPYPGWVDPATAFQPSSGMPGLLTFRGNPTRTFYGTGPAPQAPEVLLTPMHRSECPLLHGCRLLFSL